MLTAIPVRWLEDNRGWRVKTNLTASGSGVGSGTFNVQRSTFNVQGLPQQNAEGGALAGEKHSRESLRWACASHEPPFGVPALAGPDRLKAGLQTSGVSTDQFMISMRALPAWRRAGGKSSRRAISEFGFRISDFRRRAGWTLIESIAVLAVIAVLAAIIAPTIITRVDRAAWTKETADLNAIGDAFTQSILRTKTIPSQSTWASAVASQMSLPVSAISTNARRYARAFYIDHNLDINSASRTIPYTQGTNGTFKPVSARVMIVASLAPPLPA